MDYEAARDATIAANAALLASLGLGLQREEKKIVQRQLQEKPEWLKALKPRKLLPRAAKRKTQLVKLARDRNLRKRKRQISGTDSDDDSGSMSESLNDDEESTGPDSDGYDNEGFLVSARNRADRELYERDESNEATAPYEVRQVIKHSASGKTSVVHTRVLQVKKQQATRPRVIRSLSTESTDSPARRRQHQRTTAQKYHISPLYTHFSGDDNKEETYARHHKDENEVIFKSKHRKWVPNTKEERLPPTLAEKKALQLKAKRTKRTVQNTSREPEVIDLVSDSSNALSDGVYCSTKRRISHRSRHKVNVSGSETEDNIEVVVVSGLS